MQCLQVCYAQIKQKENDFPLIETSDWNAAQRLLPITGKCLFFEKQLLNPDQCKIKVGSIKKFPSLFEGNGGLGFGTYYINLLAPENEATLSLYLPQIYSCYKLWINDALITETGVVERTAEKTKPQWLTKIVTFKNDQDTISIVLQVANFHHAKGGVKENLFLGTEENISNKIRISTVANLVETIILFLIGFVFLMVFVFGERKKVALFFAMLSITWSVRSVFSNQYLFANYFPDINWVLLVRIEYITLFLTIIWGTLTVGNLFKNEASNIANYILVVFNILFTLFCLLVTPRQFTQWLNLYLVIGVMLIFYAAFVVIRAWIKDRIGSALLTISIFIGVVIFGYDILVFEVFVSYNPIIFSLGYISIFSLMAVAIALHINLIRSSSSSTTRLTYDDLFKKQ